MVARTDRTTILMLSIGCHVKFNARASNILTPASKDLSAWKPLLTWKLPLAEMANVSFVGHSYTK